MLNVLRVRWQQGQRTTAYPAGPVELPERFRGRPALDPSRCPDDCRRCADVCPTQALATTPGLRLDLARCVFCTECVAACPAGAIRYTREHRMAVRRAEDLVLTGAEQRLATVLDEKMRSLFGRSLRLREVCAGSCNGCESELQALGNVVFDLSRFGVQFVASPRHADGLVVTGPVSANMRFALLEAYAAVPAPKLVIAVGACALSGGVFRGSPEVHDGCAGLLPVDLYVPGCPPHPLTILDGLLRLLGRLDGSAH
jgi:Ni,Fe-hydrogenase III small subunit/Pyruvate/2-oxoacid:ferredoxin oxidoreductase delta subunit